MLSYDWTIGYLSLHLLLKYFYFQHVLCSIKLNYDSVTCLCMYQSSHWLTETPANCQTATCDRYEENQDFNLQPTLNNVYVLSRSMDTCLVPCLDLLTTAQASNGKNVLFVRHFSFNIRLDS